MSQWAAAVCTGITDVLTPTLDKNEVPTFGNLRSARPVLDPDGTSSGKAAPSCSAGRGCGMGVLQRGSCPDCVVLSEPLCCFQPVSSSGEEALGPCRPKALPEVALSACPAGALCHMEETSP